MKEIGMKDLKKEIVETFLNLGFTEGKVVPCDEDKIKRLISQKNPKMEVLVIEQYRANGTSENKSYVINAMLLSEDCPHTFAERTSCKIYNRFGEKKRSMLINQIVEWIEAR